MYPQAVARVAPARTVTHWIGNEAASPDLDATLPVVNPATEELICHAPYGSSTDVARAMEAAQSAQGRWAALGPSGRREHLLQAADGVRSSADEIATLLVLENGKPYREAQGEVSHATQVLREYAELAVHHRSGAQSMPSGQLSFQHRTPRGVAACITAWNFPIVLAMENIAPNLAAGNTVVAKPSEKTPLATRSLVEAAFSGLPQGVCNLVVGDGNNAGSALVEHPAVGVVVFVGSVKTGRHIAQRAPYGLKKSVLELGGKDVLIVDKTADVTGAARLAAAMTFGNCGQVCTATERVLVDESAFDQFVEELKKHATAIRVGDGFASATEMGPLIDETQLAKVEEHVQDALRLGANLVCGGSRPPSKGFFYEPTVLTNVAPNSKLMKEETFGPVAPVVAFESLDEALQMANASEYGLGAIVCTTSAPNAMVAIDALDAGMIKINGPRGKAPGATSEPYKSSGMGHNYGVEFMHELTHQKSVHWRAQIN